MQHPLTQLSIDLDPWLDVDGMPLAQQDQKLLDAVIAGDVMAVERALQEGGDPLKEIMRSNAKERRSIVGLVLWHEEEVAKPLLSLLGSLEYPDERRFMMAVLSATTRPAPQSLLTWFLRHETARLPSFDRGHYWRFLSSRGCWNVLRDCRDILWDWDNIHVGSSLYTTGFVWTRAVLSNEESADVIKEWMKRILLRYEEAGYPITDDLTNELSMHYALLDGFPMGRVIEDLSQLTLVDGGLRKVYQKLPHEHAGKSLLGQAIGLADKRVAEGVAHALSQATPEATETGRRGRL